MSKRCYTVCEDVPDEPEACECGGTCGGCSEKSFCDEINGPVTAGSVIGGLAILGVTAAICPPLAIGLVIFGAIAGASCKGK